MAFGFEHVDDRRAWSAPPAAGARVAADLYPPGALAVDGGLRSDQVTMSAGPAQNSGGLSVAVVDILSGG